MLKVEWDGQGHKPTVRDVKTGIDVPNVIAVTMTMDPSGVTLHMMVHPATVSEVPDALVSVEVEKVAFYLPDPLTGQPRKLRAIEWEDGSRWNPNEAFANDNPRKLQ